VHHIAFRAADEPDQKRWRQDVADFGYDVTPVIDRNYFRSIYFREAGGVLFEIATDPPGFAVDETEEKLGTGLMLPSRYERHRADIERHLPPLSAGADFRHLYVAPEGEATATMVALHGTGGDERDLVSLARRVGGSHAAVLSPRGKVRENGMNRFFRRHAEGIFDQEDVRRRALELADFIIASAGRYNFDPAGLSALGYSNGANIAAAILLLRPEVFSEAILFRPMMPLESHTPPDLSGRRILVVRGRFDDMIPAESTDRLVRALSTAGAQVTEMTIEADHRLTAEDITAAENWRQNCTPETCAASV
jgi:predicted esterase